MNAGKHEVSFSFKKNIKMVVFINQDASGKKSSITRFEAIRSDRPQYKRVFPRVTRHD